MNDKEMRKALFTICKSKKELSNWLRYFLDINLPDCTVDSISNSNPMDLMWEIYQKALDGKDTNFTELLLYSARSGYKTVFCALLVVLGLLHLRRSSCVLAAVEPQAQMTAKYVARHFKRPYLRDHLGGKNRREIEAVWHENHVGEILSPDEWSQLTSRKYDYVEKKYSCQILVATLSGVNSPHVPLLLCDELDLAPPGPLEEMKLIPDRGDKGQLPITFYTSSRKFAIGNVQKMLDKAGETGLNVRHWNILDVTSRCEESRHRPDLPKLKVYRSDFLLKTISEDEYKDLDEEKQKRYVEDEAYNGCMTNCKIFSSCKGLLATKQTSTSPLLKSIDSVQALFRNVDPELAKAQLLGWKPSTEGMIYGRLEHDRHVIPANKIAEMITGEKYGNLSKKELVAILKQSQHVRWFAGMDFGFTHCFALSIAAVFGSRVFIVDAYELPELELHQQLAFCNEKLKPYDAEVYPDPAYPAYVKTFSRHGFKMRSWKKGPGSVLTGITAVRAKISPVIGDPDLYFVRGDEGCELAYRRLAYYHWTLDKEQNPTDVPSDEDDDLCDSVRYLIMNVFSQRGRILASHGDNVSFEQEKKGPMQQFIEEALADAPSLETTGKRGKLGWSF